MKTWPKKVYGARLALQGLDSRGYQLAVKTKTITHKHKVGTQTITYADKLLVSGGPGPLDDELSQLVKAHQPYLLAAACVRRPPEKPRWVARLVRRARKGKIPTYTLTANIASFIGKHPGEDGPDLEAFLEEALK